MLRVFIKFTKSSYLGSIFDRDLLKTTHRHTIAQRKIKNNQQKGTNSFLFSYTQISMIGERPSLHEGSQTKNKQNRWLVGFENFASGSTCGILFGNLLKYFS